MIKNKLTLDTNQMALQELINFRKLVYKTISQPPHLASDYDEFQVVKEFLLDLILVLILFKKYEPKNIFFNQENKDDLEKKKQDEYQLDKFISINGLIRGLVYDSHYSLSNNNFILSCWSILVKLKIRQTTINNKGPINIVSAGDYLKTILNKLLNNAENRDNITFYIDSMLGEGDKNVNEPRRQEKNLIAKLLHQIHASKKAKEVCFMPRILALDNTQANIHFLIPSIEIELGFHVYLNKYFIQAKALNINLKSILTYDPDTKDRTPKWGSSLGSGDNPLLIYNIENFPGKLDIIALDFFNSLDIGGNFGHIGHRKIKESISLKSTRFINEVERFLRLLNNNGELFLIFDKHILNIYRKKILSLFNKTISIINLKRKVIIVASNNPQKSVSIFNVETLNMGSNLAQKGFQTISNHDMILVEYKNRSGDYWIEISRDQLLAECKNKFNINKFFLPEIEGIPLKSVINFLNTERIKPNKSDIIINVSSLNQIPGILDFENKVDKSGKQVPVCQKVEKSCLLIATTGNKLKPTEFIYKGFPIYLMPGVVPLEINESITSVEFISYVLRSDEIKNQLKFITTGSTIARYQLKDILDLKIICPKSKITQQTIINERKESVFKELKLDNLLKETQNAKFKKIRGISHDMGDYFSNIFPNIDLILDSVQSKKDKEINKFFNDEDLNLLENLKILQKDINSLSILNSQFKEDLDFSKKYPLKIYSALEIYKLTLKILKSYKSKLFSCSVQLRMLDLLDVDNKKINEKKIKEFKYDKLGFRINEEAFERFLRQFVTNTKKHAGFEVERKKENKFIVRFDFDELNLNIIIMNNGKPFPMDMTKEQFIQHGVTSNSKEGKGDGGEIINEISNYFQFNDWSFDMNNDDKFPVKFKFPLYLEHIE